MFKKIVAPVDLAHKAELGRGLGVAVDLAKHYGATLTLIGVTGTGPGNVAHNPDEYTAALTAFASDVGEKGGIEVQSVAVVSNDPAVELENRIAETAKELGADLAVMASHKPGLLEHIFSSHAGYLASHADLSVFVVR